MTKQSLDLGTAVNDGTGDSLRSGGTKINANFTELYTAIGGNATTIPNNNKTVFHSTATVVQLTSGTTYTLSNGEYTGEVRVLINTAGNAITVTPTTFANGTSFVLSDDEGCMLIWTGSTWFIIGNQSQVSIT